MTAAEARVRQRKVSIRDGTLCFGDARDEIALATRAFDGRCDDPRMVLPSYLRARMQT